MKTEHACQEIRPQLVALLDDQLDPARSQPVQAHLAACEACRAELDGLRRALQVVDGLPATEPSPDLPALALGSALAVLALVVVLEIRPGTVEPIRDEVMIANHLDLFADYEAIEQLDLLEDLDVLEALGDEV